MRAVVFSWPCQPLRELGIGAVLRPARRCPAVDAVAAPDPVGAAVGIVLYARSVNMHGVGRMIIAPVGVAVAVGLVLRPLGSAAVFLASASFFAAQLAVGVQSRRQLEDAKRRLAASRVRQQR